MTFPLQSIIAKQDHLAKVYWGPVFPYLDELLMTDKSRPAEEITPEYAYAVIAFQLAASAHGRNVPSFEDFSKENTRLRRENPERAKEIDVGYWKAINKSRWATIGFNTEWKYTISKAGQLSLIFYEVNRNLNFENRSIAVTVADIVQEEGYCFEIRASHSNIDGKIIDMTRGSENPHVENIEFSRDGEHCIDIMVRQRGSCHRAHFESKGSKISRKMDLE